MTPSAKARIEARREEGVRKLRARAASIEAEERIRLERCSWDAAEMERQLHTGSRSHYYPRTGSFSRIFRQFSSIHATIQRYVYAQIYAYNAATLAEVGQKSRKTSKWYS